MKKFIATVVYLLVGLVLGWYFEQRYADRQMAEALNQGFQQVQASDRLEAARGIRAIQLTEAGDKEQAIEMFSWPIADFYVEFADAGPKDDLTIKMRAEIEQFAKTNEVVAARINEAFTNH
jgi:hypothetical protein